MPAPTPVIGVEFEAVSISNGSGGTLTLFVTVVNAAGEFTVRLVQTGTTIGFLVITRDDGQVFTWDCASGSRTLIRRQDNNVINRPWDVISQHFFVQGGT